MDKNLSWFAHLFMLPRRLDYMQNTTVSVFYFHFVLYIVAELDTSVL